MTESVEREYWVWKKVVVIGAKVMEVSTCVPGKRLLVGEIGLCGRKLGDKASPTFVSHHPPQLDPVSATFFTALRGRRVQ
jgi:hypothetical protein